MVYGTADPNPEASGGAALLMEKGVAVDHLPIRATDLLNEPHVHRVRTPVFYPPSSSSSSCFGTNE